MTVTKVMDILLEVLNARATVADHVVPMLNQKTSREILQRTADEWDNENLIRDAEGELDYAGLIMGAVTDAVAEPFKDKRRKKLLVAAAVIVAALQSGDVLGR